MVDLLPTVDVDRARLGEYLIELALSKTNHSSRAVYNAILALASYHRGSNVTETEGFKSSSLNDLLAQDRSDLEDNIRHIAANLLLCVVEVREVVYHRKRRRLTERRCNRPCQEIPAGLAIYAV